MPTSLSSCPDVLEFGVSSLGIVKNRCYDIPTHRDVICIVL